MSVNSKARNPTSIEDLIYDYKVNLTLLHALLRDRKGFSAAETKPIGTAAGSTNAATGFLRTEGDTMIGPIAFFPDLTIIDSADDSINISKEAQIAYTSRVIVSTSGGSSDLETIFGAGFAGQILMIQGILTETITIKHGLGNIRTFDGSDIEIVDNQNIWFVFDSVANEWAAVGGSGGGSGTGTFISADLVANQTANLAVGNHIEFDRNATPTGADGGIILQTGAGQLDGIFELLAGKTYFLSGRASPIISAQTVLELAWYDITNGNEIGTRALYDVLGAANLEAAPKCEIIFTPTTDVTVELRIVALTTPANLAGFFAAYSFAHIFEFSGRNGSDGAPGAPGVAGSIGLKDPVRAKTLVDVSNLAAFTVVTDGVTLIQNDRVLLTEQTSPAQNGIYDVGVVAAGLAPLTRSLDLDVSSELVASLIVLVEEGATKKDTMWQLISNNPLTIGVSSQVWQEFGGTGGTIPGVGQDGKDATGSYVLDGRIFSVIDKLKTVQQDYGNIGPTYAMNDLLYIPADDSVFNNEQLSGNLIVCGRMDQTPITTNGAISSNYGESWTAVQITGSGNNPTKFAYDPIQDIAICISGGAPLDVDRIRRSTDKGLTWLVTAFAGGIGFTDVIWSARLSLFIGLSLALTNAIWTSPDGNTWTNRTTAAGNPDPPTLSVSWNKLDDAPGLGKVVVVADRSLDILTSTDGITWILEPMGDVAGGTSFTIQQTPTQLIWSEGQQQFLMKPTTGNTDTEGIFLSPDGINWTQVMLPNQAGGVLNGIYQIRWMAEYSVWIGIGKGAIDASLFWVSTNGTDWIATPTVFRRKDVDPTEASTFFTAIPRALTYAPEFGYIFGVGNSQRTSGAADYLANRYWRTEVYFQGKLDHTSS